MKIADKSGEKHRIVEHLESAHTLEDLAALAEAGKAKLCDLVQAQGDPGRRD